MFTQHATTLQLHGRWPSYKPYGVASNRILDGCPINCHTHVLTVTNMDDSNDLVESFSEYDLSENGTMENGNICICLCAVCIVECCIVTGWESELQDCTRYVFTTMAVPDLLTGLQNVCICSSLTL